MEAQSAVDGPRKAVAARAIDRVLAEHAKRGKGQESGQFAEKPEIECGQKKSSVDRNQKGNRHQEAEQQLERRSGVFERLAGDFSV